MPTKQEILRMLDEKKHIAEEEKNEKQNLHRDKKADKIQKKKKTKLVKRNPVRM